MAGTAGEQHIVVPATRGTAVQSTALEDPATREAAPGDAAGQDRGWRPERVRSVAMRWGRFALGVVLALAVNVVVLAAAIPLGFYLHRVYVTVALAEAALLVACLVAAVVVRVRRRRGLGSGLVVGWATGYVGLVLVVVLLFAALLATGAVLIALWWLLALLLAIP